MTNARFTTMQELRRGISKNGAVIRYSEKVFVVDGDEENGYTAEVYEFPDLPCELGYLEDECRLECVVGPGRRHRDAGHALNWCIRLR